jgi:hypothetical protein
MEFNMAEIKPKIGVEYADNATIVSFTDEKILEERDIKALQDSKAQQKDLRKGRAAKTL